VTLASGPPSWLGMGQALAAPLFAGCLLAGVLAGEVLASRPSGPTRTAAIEVRTVRSYLPRAMSTSVLATAVTLTGLLVVTSLLGTSDDQGRPGRSLSRWCGEHGAGAGPWPGVYYSVPIGLSVLGGLLAAAVVALVVVRRPRPAAGPAARAADDDVRRASLRAVTAACGVLTAAPLAGVATIVAALLADVSHVDCAPSWLPLARLASGMLGAVAFVAACGYLSALLLPMRRAVR